MSVEPFTAVLLSAYRERPCQVLPNALWKTLAELPNYACTFTLEGDCVTHLKMLRDDALLLYWQRDQRSQLFPESMLADLRFALLHADFVNVLTPARSGDRPEQDEMEAYFRLRHDLASVPEVTLPTGFRFVDVCIEREASTIAEFIAECYDDITLSAADVRGWPRLSVFDPHLAFWIVDTAKDKPAALAVSCFDAQVPEASLEWIQVHPDYRRHKLGTALVYETLSRVQGRAIFATVSGAVDNPTNPEALYRKCRFYGEDVWFVLRR